MVPGYKSKTARLLLIVWGLVMEQFEAYDSGGGTAVVIDYLKNGK